MKRLPGLFVLAAAVVAASALPSATFAADAAAETATLDEIVITAEHREASAQRSAIAITVVSSEQMARQGITSSKDLLDSVPGLDLTQASPNANLSLRGLGSGSGTAWSDPVVAFNIGGVPLGRQYATTASMYDVARIEILKGPQGTLYGRNATVGALNIVPNRPTDKYEGNANLSVGNYGTFNLGGAINLPLSDRSALRLAVASNKHDGYLTNGYNDANNQSGRLSYSFKPSDTFNMLLWADYYNDDSNGPSTVVRYVIPGQEYQFPDNPWFAWGPAGCGNPAICPSWANSANFIPGAPGTRASAPSTALSGRSVTGSDGFLKVKQQIYAAEMNWTLGASTLTVIPAYVSTKVDFHSYQAALDFTNHSVVKQQSIEARLASSNDARLKWLVGAFYYNEDNDVTQQNLETDGYQILFSPSIVNKSWAAFADTTWSLTDNFRLSAGLRYTQDKKHDQGGWTLLDGLYSPTAPAPAGNLGVCPPTIAGVTLIRTATSAFGNVYPSGYCIVPNSGDLKENSSSWKVGVEYDLAADSLLYANARTGFKAGGFAPGLPPNTYKPEQLTAYEIGSKNRFLNQRLQANLEVFYWKYKDQQIGVLRPITPGGQSSFPVNVPGNLKGAELSVEALVTNNDRITVDWLYTAGKYDIYPQIIIAGQVAGGLINYDRINLPHHNASLGYEHDFKLANSAHLMVNLSTHYESDSVMRPVAATLLTAGDRRNAFAKHDAGVTYTSASENWSLTGYVKNLADKAVIGSGTSGATGPPIFFRTTSNPGLNRYAAIEAPRTYGVRLSAKF
jgi:iron complex outermembrane recepter protein